MKVNARKVRAAHNAMVSVIEWLAESGLHRESGDSLLLDDANKLRRRIILAAAHVGLVAES